MSSSRGLSFLATFATFPGFPFRVPGVPAAAAPGAVSIMSSCTINNTVYSADCRLQTAVLLLVLLLIVVILVISWCAVCTVEGGNYYNQI
jgi:hypothetical protein